MLTDSAEFVEKMGIMSNKKSGFSDIALEKYGSIW